jgi:hypothetical protein
MSDMPLHRRSLCYSNLTETQQPKGRNEMSKLTIESLNYSRTAGMVTISGKDYYAVAKKMAAIDGVDGIEHDEDNGEYVLTFNKASYDNDGIKILHKECKKK